MESTKLIIILLLIINITKVKLDIIDYTREDYVLIENNEAQIYENMSTIYHISHLTYYEEIVLETAELNKMYVSKDTPSLSLEIEMIETLLEELKTHRNKRGIDEIGQVWKWISGSPDHDDLITIENK